MIAQEVAAAGAGDEALVRHIVHPVGVGRDEEIGRGALLDLPGQGRGGAIGEPGRRPAGGVIGLTDLIKGVLQGGRGEHQHPIGRVRRRREG